MNCQICGVAVDMPYNCTNCGGQFCSQHRLLENHACPQLNRTHTQRQNNNINKETHQTGNSSSGGGYNYSFNFNPHPNRTYKSGIFSPKELKHLGIAALLVTCIGFSIGLYNSIGENRWPIGMMAIFSVCLTASFLVHELAHKITAQKRGLWAEFRLTTWGAIMTLASVFLPFKMIGPGAMMIGGPVDRRSMLKISIAGPITNIIFASAFFALSVALQSINNLMYGFALGYVGFISAFIAVFNLFPFGPLDGLKIFMVDKKIWAAVFIVSLVLTIYGYLLVF